jgi:hypothetical protein
MSDIAPEASLRHHAATPSKNALRANAHELKGLPGDTPMACCGTRYLDPIDAALRACA